MFEQCVTFFVGLSCSNERDVHTHQFRNRVDIDFREDDLLGHTKSVVATAVELAFDTLEVADTRQCDANEAFSYEP